MAMPNFLFFGDTDRSPAMRHELPVGISDPFVLAVVDGDGLVADGEVLTSNRVRAAIREACQKHGAPAPTDLIVSSAWEGGGHEPGSGPLPANLPIVIDLWPRDDESGCYADMTRTFVVGEVPAAVR